MDIQWWRILKYVFVILWPFLAAIIIFYVLYKCRQVKTPSDEEIDKYDCGIKHTTCGIETDVKKHEDEKFT